MRELIDIVTKLRSKEGCPWDRKQTHQSLISDLLEETWEVIAEIQENRLDDSLMEELGDLLFQVVLHAQIGSEDKRFTIEDIIQKISQKMVERHPHVFGPDAGKYTEEELLARWQEKKRKEKKHDSLLDNVPFHGPQLSCAYKIGQKVATIGFDWSQPSEIFEKVKEEMAELEHEMKTNHQEGIQEEIGDLLFTIANLARFYKLDPELALAASNQKFKKRFVLVEQEYNQAKQEGREPTLGMLEKAWQKAKAVEVKS